MSNSVKFLAIAALALSTVAIASPLRPSIQFSSAESAESTYTAGSQYTATLDQTNNQWRMQPANGQDVVIDAGSCATGAMVPTGFWLLVVDSQGGAELVAPSVTRLPAGSPDRIALRACDAAQGRQLAVPQTVLDLLVSNTGAIYVTD
jgi:hypothetical protein